MILVEVRGGWRFQFDFLGGAFQIERRRSLIWRISYFCKGTSPSFFQGLLGSGLSNETVLSDGHSLKDMRSEFEGVARRSGRMERSNRDHLYLFSKKFNTEV